MVKLRIKHIIGFLILGVSSAAISQKPYYSKQYSHYEDSISNYGEIDHTVYLIGDAGENEQKGASAVDLLKNHIKDESKKSTVLFLGDNIYPSGIPGKDDKDRAIAESTISKQLDLFNTYPGQVYYIPGNHDWDQWSKDGWNAVKREGKFIEKHEEGNIEFLPNKGCPGPVKIKLKKDVLLLIVDTQWWLHKWDKPYGENCKCDVNNEFEFIEEIRKIVAENDDKQILLAGHHPVFFKW